MPPCPSKPSLDLFTKTDERRREFKSHVLREAITKCESTGVQIVDLAVTEFRKRHYAHFQKFFGDEFRRRSVHIRPPAPTYKGDTWFEVRSAKLPKGAYVNHKASMGVVDLTFPYTDVAALRELTPHLEPDMAPVQTNKSAAIRIEIPRILSFDDFDRERESVEKSFVTVRRLLQLFERERARFESVLNRSKFSEDANVWLMPELGDEV